MPLSLTLINQKDIISGESRTVSLLARISNFQLINSSSLKCRISTFVSHLTLYEKRKKRSSGSMEARKPIPVLPKVRSH